MNFYQTLDKKLTKNLLKRCVVEPFTEKLMKKTIEDGKFEMQRYVTHIATIDNLNKTLCLISKEGLLSNHLKIVLRGALGEYIQFLEEKGNLKESF